MAATQAPLHAADISIAALRQAVKGPVIGPTDPGYDEARAVFQGGIDRRPAAIVRVVDAADVAHVVSLARETGVELAVRGGGHSAAGHGVCDGGIVIDLRAMRALDIDLVGRTAWAEAGMTAAEACAHRDRRVMVNVAAACSDRDEAAAHEGWVTDFAAALARGSAGA